MTEADYNHLIDHRSDPEYRMVLEDIDLEYDTHATRLGLALWIASSASDDDADAASDDASDDDADDASDHDDDDDADASSASDAASSASDDDADAASDADVDADADVDKIKRLNNLLTKEPDMRNGLKIIQVPGRYGAWAVTRVGWLRRVNGDEWELIGARTIVRTGSSRTLDSLAATGPAKDHRLSDASTAPEEIHRLVIRRSLQADEKVWAQHCPRPEGWSDE